MALQAFLWLASLPKSQFYRGKSLLVTRGQNIPTTEHSAFGSLQASSLSLNLNSQLHLGQSQLGMIVLSKRVIGIIMELEVLEIFMKRQFLP